MPLPQMLGGTDGNFLAATLCIAELLHQFGAVLGVAERPTFLQLHVCPQQMHLSFVTCSLLRHGLYWGCTHTLAA